jgi:RNA polymerase-binding transcription factor DksA
MKTDKYKEKLEAEKKLLEEELGSLGKVDETGDWQAVPETEINTQEVQDEADMADRSEDFEERALKVDRLEARLIDVNKALEEIENNKYGKCETCGKEIEEDRLEANPAAHTCKACM